MRLRSNLSQKAIQEEVTYMRMCPRFLIGITLMMVASQSSASATETSRVEVSFSVSRTGHILFEVEINRKKASVIVDSGAEMCVIHEKQAAHLGLDLKKANGTAGGLGGEKISIKPVNIDAMTIGKVAYDNPPFVALDLRHVESAAGGKTLCGLIGGDFLKEHGALVDYKAKTISFLRPDASSTKDVRKRSEIRQKKRVKVPFTMSQSGHFFIAAKINNRDACLGVDTAAGVNLIAEKEATSLGLKLERSRGSVGGLGRGVAMHAVKVPSLTINGVTYQSPPFDAVDLHHGARSAGIEKLHGVIGAPFLHKYGAVIDYEDETISFEKP